MNNCKPVSTQNRSALVRSGVRAGENDHEKGLALCALKGLLVSIILGGVLLILLSLILKNTGDPDAYVSIASVGALYLSALVGGLLTEKLYRRSPLLCGLVTGCAFTVFSLLLSLLIGSIFDTESDMTLPLSLLLRGGAILFEIIGAYLGKQKPKKTHRAAHSRRR